jgi:SNF2 family DNA or RNA helicase
MQKKVDKAFALARSKLRGRLIAPYQPDGVRWMLEREFSESGVRGGILADEMGLGKTVQVRRGSQITKQP